MKSLLSITEITKSKKTSNFRAYLLESTAQISTEKKEEDIDESVDEDDKPSNKISEIVKYISDAKIESPNIIVNVVIQIHGYNTGKKYKLDYEKAHDEIYRMHQSSDDIVIFLGYAWPSEQIALFNRKFISDSLKSLPGWLQLLSLMGMPWIGAGLLWLGMNIFAVNPNNSLNVHLGQMQKTWSQILDSSNNSLIFLAKFIINLLFYTTALSSLITTITLVLILLRSTVYFRDSYRATHYGVPDLVQFFRAFEYLLLNRPDSKGAIKDTLFKENRIKLFKDNRIKLSFVAHSMGAFVTTNLVRALSDVFDSNDRNDALSIIDGERISSNQKNSNIGKCFSLERLILISPDIPVNAILSGRSNFLRSSLSRFQESHLFSNEGDLVLLLLSTVANYISFPSTTSQMGYKLGNLGVDNEMETIDQYKTGQFTRIERQPADIHDVGNILNNLVIGVEHDNLIKVGNAQPYMAQEFTYFDCTNYFRSKFFKDDNKKIRNYKKLTISNYARLIFLLPNSHVQYFYEPETMEAIYTIACKGFNNFITSDVGKEILQEDHPIKVLKATAEIKIQSGQVKYEI